jgi:cell division protein FtsI (penicillin-binding protein 3)
MVLSLFLGRLMQIQGLDARAYAAAAEQDRLRTKALPATRGTITDVDGVALAESVDVVNVTTDQTLVTDPAGEAAALAPLLRLRPADVASRLTGTRRFGYVAKTVQPTTWRTIRALGLPGIFAEPAQKRVYPAGDLAASVIGFVGADGKGAGGIEHSLDTALTGRAGELTYESAAGGRQIPTGRTSEQAAVPGSDVRLTIDRDIQWVAQREIAAKVKATGALSGTVVVMDPRTGDILAMATAPTFDANTAATTPSDLLGNRALSDVYEPGSTSKVMTAAAAIEEGVANQLTPVTVPNTIRRAGKVFHDDISHSTWHLTMTGVLAKSSNIGAIQIAEKMPATTFADYLTKFGMGQPTGLRFPGESRGILAPVADWSGTQRYTVAFGQGLSVNAVQQTSVFATLANDGVRVAPRLVAGVTGPDGRFVPAPAAPTTKVVSPATATAVRQMLETVVGEEGTAPMAQIAGYRVAGKTGTAQRVDDTCHCYRGYTASFIGMAPADHPRLVVSVTLQRPVHGHFGGRLAGPVFRDVMAFALQTLRIPPTGTKPPRLPLTTAR